MKVRVLGAGTMGSGIAQAFALSGYQVIVRDLEQAFVDKGIAGVAKSLDRIVAKGNLSDDDRKAALARLTGTTDLAKAADVDLVVEALENGKMKDVAFIEALACPAGCVGGPLTVENPYIARARIRSMEHRSAAALEPRFRAEELELSLEREVSARAGLALAPDMLKAMLLLEETVV